MPASTAPPLTRQSQPQASRVDREPRDIVARIASAGAGQWKGLLKAVLLVVAVLLLLEVRSTKRYVQQHQSQLPERGNNLADSSFKLPSVDDVQHVEQRRSETKKGNVRGGTVRIIEKRQDAVDQAQLPQPRSTIALPVSVSSRKAHKDTKVNRQKNKSSSAPAKQKVREGGTTLAEGDSTIKHENGTSDPETHSKSPNNAKGKNKARSRPTAAGGSPRAQRFAVVPSANRAASKVQMASNLLEVCGRNLHVYLAQQASGFGGVGNLVTKVGYKVIFRERERLLFWEWMGGRMNSAESADDFWCFLVAGQRWSDVCDHE